MQARASIVMVLLYYGVKGPGLYCVALPSLGCFPYLHLIINNPASEEGVKETAGQV